MENISFTLIDNAFFILGAKYASTRSELAELVEETEFDERFSADVIQSAQQSLLAPIARLNQELSWLPELSELQIANIVDLIARKENERLKEVSQHLPELAKANVLSHLISTSNNNLDAYHFLTAAWDEVDKQGVLVALNEQRRTAGFPTIEPGPLGNAINTLESKHASSAAAAIWTLEHPGGTMEKIVETELIRHPSSSFLEKLVRSYDALSEPNLARISSEIDSCIEKARQDKSDLSTQVNDISDLLVGWDEINQPVQIYEQYQGHEEARSKRIYEKLRVLCLELANDRGRYSEAKQLSEALLRTFPELESVAEVLKGDVAQLETLDEQQKQQKQVEPLIAACEAAKKQLPKVKKALTTTGFSERSKGPVGDILIAFRKASLAIGDNSILFLIVRDLALHINNDRHDPETAFKLVDGLLSYGGEKPTKEIREKLEEERSVLHRNWKMGELENNVGNVKAMLRTVEDLLQYASGSERTELLQLKNKIGRKQLGKRIKWGVYASIAAVVGFIMISEELNRPTSRATYQPSTSRVTPPTQTPSTTTAGTQETIPPVGQGLVLNRSQIRYCVFQGERLNFIRPLTSTNYQIDRFNRLINDYNSRCSNYRYNAGVLPAVQREAVGRTSELKADARRIFSSW